MILILTLFNTEEYLANLCQRRHSMLAKHWDNVHPTAKIMLLFLWVWLIYNISSEWHY